MFIESTFHFYRVCFRDVIRLYILIRLLTKNAANIVGVPIRQSKDMKLALLKLLFVVVDFKVDVPLLSLLVVALVVFLVFGVASVVVFVFVFVVVVGGVGGLVFEATFIIVP